LLIIGNAKETAQVAKSAVEDANESAQVAKSAVEAANGTFSKVAFSNNPLACSSPIY
jgi:hypothetical protein